MEQYLNEGDCTKLEIEELEPLLDPEDSEVHLRHTLRNASRRGGKILEIFNSKDKSEHLVASKVRWDWRQRPKVAQEEKARGDVQEVDDKVDQTWTAACEWTAKKMLKYLEDCEAMKVSTGELKEQVLSPDESNVRKCMLRGSREVREAKSCFRFSDKARKALREEQLKGLGGAGEALPGAQGGGVAFTRETKSYDCSDGGQDEHAEDRIRRLSEADLPGVERAGGAEDKGSAGTRTKER